MCRRLLRVDGNDAAAGRFVQAEWQPVVIPEDPQVRLANEPRQALTIRAKPDRPRRLAWQPHLLEEPLGRFWNRDAQERLPSPVPTSCVCIGSKISRRTGHPSPSSIATSFKCDAPAPRQTNRFGVTGFVVEPTWHPEPGADRPGGTSAYLVAVGRERLLPAGSSGVAASVIMPSACRAPSQETRVSSTEPHSNRLLRPSTQEPRREQATSAQRSCLEGRGVMSRGVV